ncbi:DUF4157 domain-containing protein [Pseudoalteromonas sp. MMG012]|uniref:eCIS core domain-containing protein n=1 Tax=Pseudoalteromonas sp. MMG012 TaxID=2822686 RepID=UPI001B3A6677|nr:DUF4157 domain-containing protein [Pseudoalteromonas sp. MMG012]MBQ4851959.1 DUF4157 domain-containing protein [Pseudoalteromonas sp. MMG012]
MWLTQAKCAVHRALPSTTAPPLMQRKMHRFVKGLTRPHTQGLPPRLKRGMEKLTGVNLANVQVHYNSPKPALVQAHAYAQGKDIYLSPGQEKHLPHELGHIAQQALGMVKPTTEVNGVAVNDDPALEQQATDWGEMAVRLGEQG